MSYEISGALGIKMANPDKDVIAFVGDGSYLLNNSDIYSSVLTNNKLIIIVCDNGGHAVILGFSWLKMTKVSFDNSSKNKNFYEEKINTEKYFFDKILPRIDSHYHSAIAGSESLMKAKFN